jgi:BolA family transcriptional regulator, general stress-responsive regulator
MQTQNRVIDEMEARLRSAFTVAELEIEDESDRHRGHAGWREGGETHFHIRLAAPELAPLSRIERHRAVHAALGADLVARIHALRMTLG